MLDSSAQRGREIALTKYDLVRFEKRGRAHLVAKDVVLCGANPIRDRLPVASPPDRLCRSCVRAALKREGLVTSGDHRYSARLKRVLSKLSDKDLLKAMPKLVHRGGLRRSWRRHNHRRPGRLS